MLMDGTPVRMSTLMVHISQTSAEPGYHLTAELYCELLLCKRLTVIYCDRVLKAAVRLSVSDCFHIVPFSPDINIFQKKAYISLASIQGLRKAATDTES